MKQYESIVMVGSSGAGKTTLVNGLRTPEWSELVVIPKRYITRPSRRGDDLSENTHIDVNRFRRGVEAGIITPYWLRELDNGRQESYGFDRIAPDDRRLRIYSANNAILRNRNPSVVNVLQSGLVIVAMSHAESRNNRLAERSPDMSRDERKVRLADEGSDLTSLHSDIEVIDTTNLTDASGQLALQEIVKQLV